MPSKSTLGMAPARFAAASVTRHIRPSGRNGASTLLQPSKAAFVNAVLADLPETPPCFPRMKEINRNGPVVRGLGNGVPPPAAIATADAAALVEDGALVIDLRSLRPLPPGIRQER